MNKNIFYFSPFYYGVSKAAAVRASSLVKDLADDFNFYVYSCEGESSGNEAKFVRTFFQTASNKSSLVTRLIKEVVLGLEMTIRFLGKSRRDGLILISSPPFFCMLIVAFFMALLGKKYILDIRDIYPEVFFETKVLGRESFIAKVLSWVTRFVYKHAWKVVTVSEGCVADIKNYQQDALLVLNGAVADDFKSVQANPPADRFQVLFHGNLGHFQNIELVIELAKKVSKACPKIKFVVAGKGPKEALLAEEKLENLSFLGEVPYGEIPQLIKNSHLGLSFRTDDTVSRRAMPVKVFEYIEGGIPVILVPYCDISNDVRNYALGQSFEVEELEKIVQYVVSLVDSPEDYQTLKNSVEQKKGFYSRRAQNEKFRDLFLVD